MLGVKGRFYGRGEHPDMLVQLISAALAREDGLTAYRFADRLCRIAPPSARAFLFRAKALRQMGRHEAALADLGRALRYDPTIPEINAAILDWGKSSDRPAAVARLLMSAQTSRARKDEAASEILRAGKPLATDIRFVADGQLSGWAVWIAAGPLELRVETLAGAKSFAIGADPAHRLSYLGSAADISIATDETIVTVALSAGGEILESMTAPGVSSRARPRHLRGEPLSSAAAPNHVNVIVPVFADFEATRDCLQSLIDQTASIEIRIFVVDDASPSPEIRSHADRLAADGAVTLIRNARNLGFVGAVNAAFDVIERGDVLLLNADAWLPPGAVERLRRAAYSDARIGSAVPFSNNAEFTSFPTPFVENPMLAKADILRLDAACSQANPDMMVMIPAGTGFCLYIKEACHEAVGPLSTLYGHGYGEDIEWALAARERGYRHVCAGGVYVGHAGTLSFRSAKRALVMRNLRLIDERYPEHSQECLAFMNADPLASVRGAAERLCPPSGVRRLLVDASRRDGAAVAARARQVGAESGAPEPLILRRGKSALKWEFHGQGAGGPKCLSFDLALPGEGEAMGRYIEHLNLDRIEIADLQALEDDLLMRLRTQRAPLDVICADSWPIRPSAIAGGGTCESRSGMTPCADCAKRADVVEPVRAKFLEHQRRLRTTLGDESRVIAIDRMSSLFASHAWKLWPCLETGPQSSLPRSPARGALGVLCPTRTAEVDRFLKALGRTFAVLGLNAPVVVLGECLDDLAVMASGTVFVTGAAKPEDYKALMEFNDIGRLLSPYRSSHGWVFDEAVTEGGGPPRAFFDWSFGAADNLEGDLALDPRLCDFQAAQAVASWVQSGSALSPALEIEA